MVSMACVFPGPKAHGHVPFKILWAASMISALPPRAACGGFQRRFLQPELYGDSQHIACLLNAVQIHRYTTGTGAGLIDQSPDPLVPTFYFGWFRTASAVSVFSAYLGIVSMSCASV